MKLPRAAPSSGRRASRQRRSKPGPGFGADYHLSFESAPALFAELTPARIDLLEALRRHGPCEPSGATSRTSNFTQALFQLAPNAREYSSTYECCLVIFGLADRVFAYLFRFCGQGAYQPAIERVIQEIASSVPESNLSDKDLDVLIRALVAGEDRRFFVHRGIDSRGVIRALLTYVRTHRVQGASTITQQLVRVLTQDYQRSFARKVKEMCVACAIDLRVSKRTQALTYLRVAYYGWRMNGLSQALVRLECASPITPTCAAKVIARLRYPEPQHASPEQATRIAKRAAYIYRQIL